MTILLKDPTSSFKSISVAYLPAVADGLEYLNFFGGTMLETGRNLARGKAGGGVIGSPTINANSAVFTPYTNYVDTGVKMSTEMTMLIVAKLLTEEATMLLSNYTSARVGDATKQSLGVGFTVVGAGTANGKVPMTFQAAVNVAGTSTSGGVSTGDTTPVGVPHCFAGSVSDSSKERRITNLTTSESVFGTSADPLDLGIGTIRVGSSASAASGFNHPVEIYAAAIYSRVLSANEIATMYDFLKGYYTRRSIAV